MDGTLIAVSIGDSEDLDDLGFGQEHLDDLTLRLAKKLMAAGARLAYGGVLRPDLDKDDDQHSFLEVLLDIVSEEGTRNPGSPPLVNFQPWPWYADVSPKQRAGLFGVTQFIDVDPPGGTVDKTDDRFLWTMASALTAMRKQMTDGVPNADPAVPPSAARIVLGGKRRDWAGILPGIAEEVLYALEADRPVYLLGGYGGCAKAITDYILGEDDVVPDDLTLEGHRTSDKLAKIQQHAPGGHVEDAFARLECVLREVRADRSRLHNGLEAADNDALMRSESIRSIGRLLLAGLGRALRMTTGSR